MSMALLVPAGLFAKSLLNISRVELGLKADHLVTFGLAPELSGYNTERHGSRTGGAVDAIQIEAHNAGVRDTPAARTAFAEALVTALLLYLEDHYGWTPP